MLGIKEIVFYFKQGKIKDQRGEVVCYIIVERGLRLEGLLFIYKFFQCGEDGSGQFIVELNSFSGFIGFFFSQGLFFIFSWYIFFLYREGIFVVRISQAFTGVQVLYCQIYVFVICIQGAVGGYQGEQVILMTSYSRKRFFV